MVHAQQVEDNPSWELEGRTFRTMKRDTEPGRGGPECTVFCHLGNVCIYYSLRFHLDPVYQALPLFLL